jgi:Protein of unknown function (DUF3567)
MNVIYNSEHFWIPAYPALEGFELFDKAGLRILYVQGPQATHFRLQMEGIPEMSRSEENIDAFLDDYCSGMARPIVFH